MIIILAICLHFTHICLIKTIVMFESTMATILCDTVIASFYTGSELISIKILPYIL